MTASFTFNEKEILVALSQHDEAAFKTIYLHYWRKLYAIAYHKLKSRYCAEDVVQEVLVSLWMRRHQLHIQSLDAYLAAATKYIIMRHLAGQRTRPLTEYLHIPEKSSYYLIDYRFLKEMLYSEVNRLPEKCRIVFEYSRKHGLSNKEIATRFTISEKSVEKHITRAIRQLRKSLGLIRTCLLAIPFF